MCADRQLPSVKYKLILLGDQSVGKTSLINRFVYDYFDNASYQATIGIDFFSKNLTVEKAYPVAGGQAASASTIMQNYVVRMHIWDTAGQERYRSLIPSYVRNSAAAVVVYDIGNRESFLNAFTWIDEIKSALGISDKGAASTIGSAGGDDGGDGGDDDVVGDAPKSNPAEDGSIETKNGVDRPADDIVIMLVGNKLDVGVDGGREVSTEEAERKAREHNYYFCEVSAKNGTNVRTMFRSVAQALPGPPANCFTTAGGPASSGHRGSDGSSGARGRFGAATRDPFLVSPSMMAEADARQQQSGSGAGAAGAAGSGGGGGCC